MNEFKICNKCGTFDSNVLKEKLKELDNTAKIIVGCQSMCAIGAKKVFVIVNGIPVIADDIDALIENVKGFI